MTAAPATPAPAAATPDAIDQRIDAIAHDMAKLAWADLDKLGLVVPRDKLPAIAMEIVSRAAGLVVATAATEKAGLPWIDRSVPLLVAKVQFRASEAYARLMEEAATQPPLAT